MSVANTILNQLGGNKFIAMTGSKNFIDCTTALSMHLTSNKLKAKYLKIELTESDTYKMIFSTTKKVMGDLGFKVDEHVVVKTIDGVYCDMLQNIFTKETGLLTSL